MAPRRFPFPCLLILTALCAATPATWAFHSGGVGNCGGCHTIHFGPLGIGTFDSPDQTDVCLACHQTGSGNTWGGNPVVPGPQYPGGSFVFLAEDNIGDGTGDGTIPGHAAGHSVISFANGTVPDPDRPTAPGGSGFTASSLRCTSCHDPHGRGGTFRLLRGAGTLETGGQTYTFTNAAPVAEGAALDEPESPASRTAYRSGMAEWCANCHPSYLDNHGRSTGSRFGHPVNVPIGATIAANYNAYQGTGQPPGTGTDAYIPSVAVEYAGAAVTGGASVDSAARVSCVSCHRAHASSSPAAGRWDLHIATWAEEGEKSGSYRIPSPYPAAGPAQRQLCDKCHGDGGTPPQPPAPGGL